MKYKELIEKADNFTAILLTQNGYPVYDIMVPTNPGYCRASGTAFYVEDDKVLKDFKNLNTKERKEFLLENEQYIKKVDDIFKTSPEMRHPMPLAYTHLINDFEGTVKKGNYGCTHLIEDGKLLIFHQNEVFYKTGYKRDIEKNFIELYDEISTLVSKAYKEGKITPEGEISGNGLARLKAKNPSIFKEMNAYQSNILEIIKSFKNEMLDVCRLTYDKEDDVIVHLEINQNSYDINIPKEKKQLISYSLDDKKTEFKNVHDLIVGLYSEVSNKKLNNFIKKQKLK